MEEKGVVPIGGVPIAKGRVKPSNEEKSFLEIPAGFSKRRWKREKVK